MKAGPVSNVKNNNAALFWRHLGLGAKLTDIAGSLSTSCERLCIFLMPQMNGKPTVDVKGPQQIQQPETG